jgi:putative addiction module component (TIGR02574 family)
MVRAVSKIPQDIRALSASDKAQLLRVLLEELDGPTDPRVDAAWAAEVQRRSREIDEGVAQCLPAEKSFRTIDARLKK